MGEHTVAVQVPYSDKDRAKEIQVTGAKRELYILVNHIIVGRAGFKKVMGRVNVGLS